MNNSGLDRLNTGKSHSDKAYAQRAAKETLKFILANKNVLKFDHMNAALSMNAQSKPLSPKQLSYVDDIYEKVMDGLGYGGYKGQKSKYGVNLK